MPAAQSQDGFKSKAIFDGIETALREDGKTLVGKVKGIYGFKVKGGPGGNEGFWIVDAKNGNGSVEFNGKGKQDSFGEILYKKKMLRLESMSH